MPVSLPPKKTPLAPPAPAVKAPAPAKPLAKAPPAPAAKGVVKAPPAAPAKPAIPPAPAKPMAKSPAAPAKPAAPVPPAPPAKGVVKAAAKPAAPKPAQPDTGTPVDDGGTATEAKTTKGKKTTKGSKSKKAEGTFVLGAANLSKEELTVLQRAVSLRNYLDTIVKNKADELKKLDTQVAAIFEEHGLAVGQSGMYEDEQMVVEASHKAGSKRRELADPVAAIAKLRERLSAKGVNADAYLKIDMGTLSEFFSASELEEFSNSGIIVTSEGDPSLKVGKMYWKTNAESRNLIHTADEAQDILYGSANKE